MNCLLFIHSDADAVRFELVGTLGGVDVETVHQAWQREAFTDALRPVIADITSVTEADQYMVERCSFSCIGSALRSSPNRPNRSRSLSRSWRNLLGRRL